MDVINHNASWREFVYRTDLTPSEIREQLRAEGRCFSLRYRFDDVRSRITFSTELPMGQPDISYALTFSQKNGITLLKVTQLDWLWEKNRFAPLQNQFWAKILDAEPVDYIRYS